MCIDLSKPTLNAAIERCVNILVTGKVKFSAHDVTKALRAAVNASPDIVDIQETGMISIGSQMVPIISHDYVRDAVHELFHLGKMTSYDRRHTGSYWEYEETKINVLQLPLPQVQNPPDAADQNSVPAIKDDYDGTPTL